MSSLADERSISLGLPILRVVVGCFKEEREGVGVLILESKDGSWLQSVDEVGQVAEKSFFRVEKSSPRSIESAIIDSEGCGQ